MTPQRSNFKLIRGGQEADHAALPEPSVHLIGVATFCNPDADKENRLVTSEVMSINPLFRYLLGKTVGVLEQHDMLLPGQVERRPAYKIRWPSIHETATHAIWVAQCIFERFTPASGMGPFTAVEQRQAEMLRHCLLADRIWELADAIHKRPNAGKCGLNREAVLDQLCADTGHNRCEICNNEISRHVFTDEECRYLGPARQRCHNHIED